MKKIWKWILGIALVLFFLVLLPGSFMLGRFLTYGRGIGGFRMMERGHGFYPPMMGWFGMGFSWLLPAIIFTLVIVGFVSLVKNLVTPQKTSSPVAPLAPSVPPQKTCQNCGKAVQTDWNHCPNCGQVQSS